MRSLCARPRPRTYAQRTIVHSDCDAGLSRAVFAIPLHIHRRKQKRMEIKWKNEMKKIAGRMHRDTFMNIVRIVTSLLDTKHRPRKYSTEWRMERGSQLMRLK